MMLVKKLDVLVLLSLFWECFSEVEGCLRCRLFERVCVRFFSDI